MEYFFSRRTFNAAKNKFTNNPAALTRYVEIDSAGTAVSKGNIIDKDDWVSRIKAAAGARPILFYVHGFNTSQHDMLTRMRKIDAGLKAAGYDAMMVAFDWPSDGSVLSYVSDKNDANEIAKYMVVEGMAPFMGGANKIQILAHSMGAYVTLRAFASTGDATGANPWKIDQIVFSAADVNAASVALGTGYEMVLAKRCERVTNYYNTFDVVLQLGSGFVFGGGDRMGRTGVPNPDPTVVSDVYTEARYRALISPPGQNATLSHIWHFDDDRFYQDVAGALRGDPDMPRPTRTTTDAGNIAIRP